MGATSQKCINIKSPCDEIFMVKVKYKHKLNRDWDSVFFSFFGKILMCFTSVD